MWAMRNDLAQKSGGADFFQHISKEGGFGKKNTVNPHLPSSLAFVSFDHFVFVRFHLEFQQ
jgi:hypothetical protein